MDDFFEEWMDSIVNDTPFFGNTLGNGFNSQRQELVTNIDREEGISSNFIQQSIVSNIYRIRRNLEVENQMTELQNNMFQNLYEILTDHFLPESESELEDVKVVLTQDEFNKLKHMSLNLENLENFKELQCNVCMENYNINDNITQLDCKHFFHKNCIQNWLCNEHVTCPICRKDIREFLKEKQE